jgi:7-keto-8-aminopelargonate synthetase-like enzyme
MSDSARDIARRLLSSAADTGAPQAAVPATSARPVAHPRRGPGKQFDDHPEIVMARRRRQMIATMTELSELPSPLYLPRLGPNGPVITTTAGELANYSTYNYLGLAQHPRVVAAAQAAAAEYGASASASRIISGEITLYNELEGRLAALFDVPAAMITTSGYLTNAGVIGFLLSEGDVAVCDSLIHASVVSGTQWAGCRRITFQHNDPDALRSVLRMSRSRFDRALVVVEGHYSMEGDIGRVAELADIAHEFDCAIMVDEAHSVGVLGTHGGGIREHLGLPGDAVDIWMGTLSKALGSCGGFIAGDADVIAGIKDTAPGVAHLTCGPTPAAAAAALTALEVMAEEPQRLTRLWDNATLFTAALRDRGLDLGSSQGTPICPVLVPGEARVGFAAAVMLQRGIYAGPVSAPAVPAGSERLRFFLTSEHTEPQLSVAADTVAEAVALAAKLPDFPMR